MIKTGFEVVASGGGAVAGVVAALYRRFDQQQPAGAGIRLQRPGRVFGQSRPGGGFGPSPAGGAMPRDMTGGAGGLFGGDAGLSRLFTGSFATQAAWLLPAALLLLVFGLWLTRRTPRTDLVRAGLLLWGGWVLVTALVFSYMNGIIHQYYTVALAPGIAAVLAIGGREVWQQRHTWLGRTILAVTTAGTAVWAQTILGWSPEFLPWLRWVVLVVGEARQVRRTR
ncbi:MAG: hypothetical protein ACRDQI_12615 [Pseudonocardiaceae bacterium]